MVKDSSLLQKFSPVSRDTNTKQTRNNDSIVPQNATRYPNINLAEMKEKTKDEKLQDSKKLEISFPILLGLTKESKIGQGHFGKTDSRSLSN